MSMGKNRKARVQSKGAAKSTVSGARKAPRDRVSGLAERKMQGAQALAAAFPFNRSKAGEIGVAARTPKAGATAEPPESAVVASTLTEANASQKNGAPARPGVNHGNQPLERVRVDSSGQVLTKNFAQRSKERRVGK